MKNNSIRILAFFLLGSPWLTAQETVKIANFEIINAIATEQPCRFLLDGVESQWKQLPFGVATGALGTVAGTRKLEIFAPDCETYSESITFNEGPVTLLVAYRESTFDAKENKMVHSIKVKPIPVKPTPGAFNLTYFSVSKKPLANITYAGIALQVPPFKPIETQGWKGNEFVIKMEGDGHFQVRTDIAMHYVVVLCDNPQGKLAAISTLCY